MQDKNFSHLILELGVNIKVGDIVIVEGPVQAYQFIETLKQQAYILGAKYVHVDYFDENEEIIRYRYSKKEFLDILPNFVIENKLNLIQDEICLIKLNKNMIVDLDDEKYSTFLSTINMKKNILKIKKRQYHNIKSCSSIVATPLFAKLVYGDDSNESIRKLWNTIYKIAKVNDSCFLEKNKKILERIENRREFLNQNQFHKLHFQNQFSDLTFDLLKDHSWQGGREDKTSGCRTLPNFPTFELFTGVDKYSVNGYVRCTRPLYYYGKVVEGIYLEIKDGKIIDYGAEKNKDVLDLIFTDEQMKYIGEFAIVSSDTSINQSGLIFKNILLNENAACHIAIGYGYPITCNSLSGFDKDCMEKNHMNYAKNHIDLMIGDGSTSINAIQGNGEKTLLFNEGMWTI